MSSKGWNLKHSYAELPEIFYRNQRPAEAVASQMAVFNRGLAQTLGLDANNLQNAPEIFTGTVLPPGAKPISQAYAGYQFGHFAMLGDGRAVLLGEQITPDGSRFDIQLKGSGTTPYSRGGDGLAALSPMLREYIISEAMFFLGIPTTRSLAVALTGKNVMRDKVSKSAVLTRVASSHIRVGTFDYIFAFGTKEDLQTLADYCVWRHFPWIENQEGENKYILLFREIARLQASLIAKWQMVGFIHGVMNTDNMAISGETIDYGPCAFMDTYKPDTVFSSIDTSGRYSYKNQPIAGAWNLTRLAQALLPLIHEDEDKAAALAQGEIANYWERYDENWLFGMRAKLGIISEEAEDADLIGELLDLMETHKLDYTNTFHSLSYQKDSPFFEIPECISWHEKWQAKLGRQQKGANYAMELMKKHNPAVIPRNYRVEEALLAAEHADLSVMHNLLEVLSTPYNESEVYSLPPKPSLRRYRTFCGT